MNEIKNTIFYFRNTKRMTMKDEHLKFLPPAIRDKIKKEFIKYIDTAIAALEKQLPKKPIETSPKIGIFYGTYECPVCSGLVGHNGITDEHCRHCGQRIDWRWTNERESSH